MKLAIFAAIQEIEYGTKTTYEELKLTTSSMFDDHTKSTKTTYEELKPDTSDLPNSFANTVPRLPMRNWNLLPTHHANEWVYSTKTTYEELKLSRLVLHDMKRYCTKTTYEELKHSNTAASIIASNVPRLPMRNWNDPLVAKNKELAKYQDYLWGIET